MNTHKASGPTLRTGVVSGTLAASTSYLVDSIPASLFRTFTISNISVFQTVANNSAFTITIQTINSAGTTNTLATLNVPANTRLANIGSIVNVNIPVSSAPNTVVRVFVNTPATGTMPANVSVHYVIS